MKSTTQGETTPGALHAVTSGVRGLLFGLFISATGSLGLVQEGMVVVRGCTIAPMQQEDKVRVIDRLDRSTMADGHWYKD
jgi:hypothetical protein